MNIGSLVYIKDLYFEGYEIITSLGITHFIIRITTIKHSIRRDEDGMLNVVDTLIHRDRLYKNKEGFKI